jgi:hypothetical protein
MSPQTAGAHGKTSPPTKIGKEVGHVNSNYFPAVVKVGSLNSTATFLPDSNTTRLLSLTVRPSRAADIFTV